MYPLTSQYIPAIDDFLAQLNAGNGVAVKTNRMSTQLFGEHDAVMELLTRAMSAAYERDGTTPFVCKFLHGVEPTINGYD